jgi:hypothetical protein
VAADGTGFAEKTGMRTRSRLVVTFVFTLVLAGFALAGAAQAAARTEEHRDPARFSADAVALRQAGWSLAELASEGREDGTVSLRFTLVDGARAHAVRLDLEFASYGERLVDYRRESVAVPEEARVYGGQDELFEQLGHGAVARLFDECGGYVLGFANDDAAVSVDEYAYYVVERRVAGKDAGAALAAELRGRLAAGAHLADVSQDGANVAFVVTEDGETTRVLQATVDAAGRVVAVEVRRSPGAWQSGKLASEARLARALARGQAIERVSLSDVEGTGKVELTFAPAKGAARKAKPKTYVVDLADMVWEEEGCGC